MRNRVATEPENRKQGLKLLRCGATLIVTTRFPKVLLCLRGLLAHRRLNIFWAFGLFEWKVCPQGLASSPAVAPRLFSGMTLVGLLIANKG